MQADSIISLLSEAQNEITLLRRRNEILSAKVQVMDNFMCILHTVPASYSPPMEVDLAWRIGNAVNELNEAKVAHP